MLPDAFAQAREGLVALVVIRLHQPQQRPALRVLGHPDPDVARPHAAATAARAGLPGLVVASLARRGAVLVNGGPGHAPDGDDVGVSQTRAVPGDAARLVGQHREQREREHGAQHQRGQRRHRHRPGVLAEDDARGGQQQQRGEQAGPQPRGDAAARVGCVHAAGRPALAARPVAGGTGGGVGGVHGPLSPRAGVTPRSAPARWPRSPAASAHARGRARPGR